MDRLDTESLLSDCCRSLDVRRLQSLSSPTMRRDKGEQMAQLAKANVLIRGRSQAVRISAQICFPGAKGDLRRDPKNGDVIFRQSPGSLRDPCEIVRVILDAWHKLDISGSFLFPTERANPQTQQTRTELTAVSAIRLGEIRYGLAKNSGSYHPAVTDQ